LDLTLAGYAPAGGSLTDPPGASVIAASVNWLQATLLGTVATIIATLAIASIGLLMLAGRINVRHGLTVVLGCFILFGARTIVAGIQSGAAGGEEAEAASPPPSPFAALPPPAPPAANPDPYAGAAVPRR
jgi:type IV secretory pathway VirB2 component (pilin)